MQKKSIKSMLGAELLDNEKNVGSFTAQIILLSDRITLVRAHVKENPKDLSAIRGLIGLVNARNRHVKYAKRNEKNLPLLEKLTAVFGLKIKTHSNY